MGNGPIRRKTVQPAKQAHKSFSEGELRKLLEHEAWIRRLARSLVADENRVNELIQHALTEALKNPPRNPKPWLTVVMRAAAWRMRRSESRRKVRETAVAREEMQMPAVPGADQSETRERLVQIVQQLEEPYRETLFLHFFEDLTLEEIARRKGIPSATMRTRLRRALAQMREKLRVHYGDPSRWVFSLLPISGIRHLGDLGHGAAAASKVQAVASVGAQTASWKSIAGFVAAILVGSSTLALVITQPGSISGSGPATGGAFAANQEDSPSSSSAQITPGLESGAADRNGDAPSRPASDTTHSSSASRGKGLSSESSIPVEEPIDEAMIADAPEERVTVIPVSLADGSMSADPNDGAILIPSDTMKGHKEVHLNGPSFNQAKGNNGKSGKNNNKKKSP